MRKQQREQLRLIAVPLAQPALQLGALQQQLIATRKLGMSRSTVLVSGAEALGSRLAAHEQKIDRAPRAACCARRSSAGRPRGGGGAKRPAKHVHWQQSRGPGEWNSGGFGIADIRPRPPLTDKSRIPSEQAEAHAPVRSRTPTKRPSPAPAHDASTRRTQRRRRISNSEIRLRPLRCESQTTRLP
jgi:hypothetical protein